MATKKAELQARTGSAREKLMSRMLRFWTLITVVYVIISTPLILWAYNTSPNSDLGLYLLLVNTGLAALTWLAVVGWLALVRTLFGRVVRA